MEEKAELGNRLQQGWPRLTDTEGKTSQYFPGRES